MGWVDSSQNNDKDNLVNWRAGEEELSFADDWLWMTMNRGRKQGWHKHAKFVCFLFPSWPFLLLRKIDRPSVTTKRWRGIDKTQLISVDVGQPALPPGSSAIACLRATYDLAINYSTSAVSSDLNSCISFNHGMKIEDKSIENKVRLNNSKWANMSSFCFICSTNRIHQL